MKRDFRKANNDIQYMLNTVLEVKTLLGYRDDSVFESNWLRYMSCLEQIIDIANELKEMD